MEEFADWVRSIGALGVALPVVEEETCLAVGAVYCTGTREASLVAIETDTVLLVLGGSAIPYTSVIGVNQV
jgi:hypothetical protein